MKQGSDEAPESNVCARGKGGRTGSGSGDKGEAPVVSGDVSYQEMVEGAQCIVMRMDGEGRITYLNPYAIAFFGLEGRGCVGAPVVGTIMPGTEANRKGLLVILKSVHEGNAFPVDVEGEVERVDGQRVWVGWTLQRMGDEVLCIGSDTTLRRQAERLADGERELAAKLSATASRNEVAEMGLRAALDIASMDAGVVCLVKYPMRTMEIAHQEGLSDEQAHALCRGDVALCDDSLLNSRTVFCGAPSELRKLRDTGNVWGCFQTLVSVPVRHKDELIGSLLLFGRAAGPPTSFTLKALEALGAQTGGALVRIGTEAALRESDERCRTLFETTDDIIYTHDMEGRITSLNKAGERITGYSLAEAYGANVLDVIAPEQRERVRRVLEQKAGDSAPTVYEVDIVTKEGRVLPLEVNSQVIAEDGVPTGVQGIARDITKRKRAEEALREGEEKYRNILESIEEGYYELDIEGNLTFFNDSLCRILGYSREELMRCDISTFYPDDEAYSRARATFEEVYRTGLPRYETGWIMVRKDGSRRNVEISISLIRDDESKPVGCRGIARDVTNRIRVEEERRQLDARIQHAQKLESLGVLAGGIAHDFNNLLVGIMGNAGLALMRLPVDSPIRTNIERIESSAKRAADLTSQMLAYSGKGTFLVRPVDISSLAEEIASLLQASVTKNAVLRFDFAADLPQVLGDPGQIQQVIMNLITNASDAIGDKHGMIAVRTGSLHVDKAYLAQTYSHDELEEGSYVYVEVSDTGCGMDAETKARIFDPFFTTKFTGRGLGLAATLGIVRSHKGTIKVYSELGHGTAIKVLFPTGGAALKDDMEGVGAAVKAPALAAEHQTSAALKTPGVADALERLAGPPLSFDLEGEGSVLILDDEEMVRDLGRDVLESCGFEVLTAADGREGVELYRKHADRIAVVIIDLTMPIMNGEEAFLEIQTIAQNHRGPHTLDGSVPVILSSGYSEEEATHHFAGKRLAGFIQKPYPPKDLVKKVREVLGSAPHPEP